MLNPTDIPRAVERLRKLHLLGFTQQEQQATIQVEFATKLTAFEFAQLHAEMKAELAVLPELNELKYSLGETWARQDMIQNDLLGIYQQMIRNFNAQQRGLREHEDNNDPVIAVRPTEIVSVGDKIIKIDQERAMSKITALKLLQTAEPSRAPGGSLPGPPTAVVLSSLSEDVEDADFEETE